MTTNNSFFIFVLLIFPFFSMTTFAKCHVDDKNGLLAFKSGITSDPSGFLSSWKPTTDCCTWSDVQCGVNNRVSSIQIEGNFNNQSDGYLSGTISSSLSKLRYLDTLSLVNHRLSGHIPISIFNLTYLYNIELRNNSLTGPLPEEIRHLKNLALLDLTRNQLSGVIPDIFSSLTKLDCLDLSYNNFTGQIPSSLSSLSPSLLGLSNNYLTGKIPNFIGNFKELLILDLSSNHFTGVVPKSFANLHKIYTLRLANNLLTGTFPTMHVEGEGIDILDLSNNSFNLGTIPNWVTSLPFISSLKLAKCGIKIKIDDWKPAEPTVYEHIDLSDNQVYGSPLWLLNKTTLTSFKAANNKLKFDLEKLSTMQFYELDLAKNEVFGKVTPEVVKVEILNLSYNKLTGVIPPNNLTAETFVGNVGLCGAPLSPCSEM